MIQLARSHRIRQAVFVVGFRVYSGSSPAGMAEAFIRGEVLVRPAEPGVVGIEAVWLKVYRLDQLAILEGVMGTGRSVVLEGERQHGRGWVVLDVEETRDVGRLMGIPS